MSDQLLLNIAQVVISGLLLGGVYALFATGLNLIVGVMRVINLAHGELMMLGAYTTFWLSTLTGLNPLVAIIPTVLILFLGGTLLERFLLERTIRQPMLSALLLTFGLSTLFMGVALNLWTADFRSIVYLSGSVQIGALVVSQVRLIGSAIALTLTAASFWFLRSTRFGKSIRATAQHADVAEACGIDVAFVRRVTFGLGSAQAAAAGSLAALMFSFSPEMGQIYIAKAFAIIVLGGLGSFVGAFLGALALGLAETLAAYFTTAQLADGVPYVVLVLVLLLRPSGLFGAPE